MAKKPVHSDREADWNRATDFVLLDPDCFWTLEGRSTEKR